MCALVEIEVTGYLLSSETANKNDDDKALPLST